MANAPREKNNFRVENLPDALVDRASGCCRAPFVAALPTYRHRIKYSPKDGEQEYRPEMVEEQPIGHEVAGVQDDRRQHVQEERVGRQRRYVDAARLEQQQPDDHADGDQQAGLREDLVEFRRHVETWAPIVMC